ncbi:hypothetical protein AB1Y20_012962 [Prymnesium parvum]|uniref:Protein FAM184A/B N-terminal domain-containing protein n=1 Tax=Prymnesium parvum TaxID=97485 RepID=A0AB34IM83_PRYPA
MREDFEERERRAQMHMQRVLDSKVTAHERAMAELKEITLLKLSEEQQSADGALPALEEKFQAATRAHERNAQDLVHSMEQKLAAQHELQSAEFAVLESRHEQALTSAKKAWAEDMEQMKRQAEAREQALLERLREQGEEARLEAESATKRAEEALRAAERRAREAREQAVDECNTHWLGVVQQQSEAHAASIAAMQAAAAEQLEQEGRNVEQLELAQLKEVTEASARLREVQEALEAQKKEELEDAARRYEYLLKHTVSKLQQEMMAQLEQERRRWEHQLEEARTSAMDEQQRNLASQAESSRAAVRTAEARVLQLSELLEKERAEHLEALDSLRGESDRAHTQEVEEQHLWFCEQLQQFEKMRDDTLARLTDEMQRSFDAQRKAVKDELDQEREALTKVVATLRQEQTASQEAVDAERARETAETKRLLRQTSTEWQQRLSEDQEQRARINQEDLKRLDELASQMRELLQHERNESIEREAQLRRQHEASVNEIRETAYKQARAEHERVVREAALQATQTAQQAEQTLMAALSQKDEQIAASTLDYEAQIASMINEHSTLQEASRKALDQATEECREVREQLHSLQQVVEKQLLAAVEGMTEKQLEAIRQQQEKVAAIHKNNYNKGLEKMYEQQIESQRALTSMLDVIRQESVARHKRSAMGVAEAVEELRLRREQELGDIVAQHQTSIRQMRQQYEAQLERQATLAEEALEAQKAQTAKALSEIEHGYSRQISQPMTDMGATIQVQPTDQYNLALPMSLKNAVEEGESELREAYAQEIRRLQEEHMAEVESVLGELAEIKERAAAALSEQADLAAAREAALLSEARLEYERARNAEFEKLNAVSDSRTRNVREHAESSMDAEHQHILAEERIKIEHENLELRNRVIELEHALQECEETRVQLSREAGLVHANEVASLQAELMEVRVAVGESVPKNATSHNEQANSSQLPTFPRDKPPEPTPSAEVADVSYANAAPRGTLTRATQPSKPAGSKLRVPDTTDEVEADVHCSSHEPSSTNPRSKMIVTPNKARPSKSSPGPKPRSPAIELRAEVNEPTQRPAAPSKVDGKPTRGKPRKSGSSEELPESAETASGAGPSHDALHERRLSKPVTGKPRKSNAIEHDPVRMPDGTRGAAPSAASLEELPDGEEPANGAGASHDASHARRISKSISGKPRKSCAMGREDAGMVDGTNGSAQEINEAVSAVRPAKPAGTIKPRVSGGRLQLRSGAPPR